MKISKKLLLIINLIIANIAISQNLEKHSNTELIKESHIVFVILDDKNERISGAKLKIENTSYEFYSNINGECLIPLDIIQKDSVVIIEYISYKIQKIYINSNSFKINLINR